MSKFLPRGMGWIPDLPDPRDYTFHHQAVRPLLDRLHRRPSNNTFDAVDLRRDDDGEYFMPPEDQGPLNCSAAFAVLSLVEYFERRTLGRTFEGSTRFLYKVTRNLLKKGRPMTGDTGADLRTTLKVLTSVGVPTEEYWPYDVERFDEEPTKFMYSIARPLSGVHYFRLDQPNCDGSATWDLVTSFLAAGFPIAFGFSVPAALSTDAIVPYRGDLDSVRGGQAAVAIGYRHNHSGPGHHALMFRSSWGCQWGDCGNGWLPMAFVYRQLARDFWTLVSNDWLEAGELTKPTVSATKGMRK